MPSVFDGLAVLQQRTVVELPTATRITFALCYQLAFIFSNQFNFQFCSLLCVWVGKLFGWCRLCVGFFERPANVLDYEARALNTLYYI
jgi:hypothetical protein